MKLASSFGRYDEEWKEGDWKVKGDVPVIMMLRRKIARSALMPCDNSRRTGNFGGSSLSFPRCAPMGGRKVSFRHSLITYPAPDRYTTPAHAAY